MSKCQDLEPLFASYVDGEARVTDRAAVEAHLDRCPPCRARLAAERAAHVVLVATRSRLRGCASEHLRARCAAYAGAAGRRTRPFRAAAVARRWLPLSLAATLLLAIAGAFFYGLNDSVEALATQLTLDHVICFQFAPERLEHADASVAGREWLSKEGWALAIPPGSAGKDLELLGVRRCFMGRGRVAHVMYKWHGQPLSVFVVPRTIRRGRQINEITEKFGHEAIIWSDSSRTYVVLARGRPAELDPIVGYVRATAH